MKYTKKYFIDKFQAIPEEKWTEGILSQEGCCCALGHCGVLDLAKPTEEAKELTHLLLPVTKKYIEPLFAGEIVYYINDSCDELGDTPKQRILNALNLVPDETP